MFELSYVIASLVDFLKAPKVYWSIAIGIVAIVGYFFLSDYQKERSRVAASELASAKSSCQSFIDREFNDFRLSEQAWVIGAWEKKGHIVVEVAWRTKRGSSTYNSRLCVVNPETKRMQSPGAFGRGDWEEF